MAASSHAPGWYPDPYGPGQRRWFDGSTWTDEIEPMISQPFYVRPPSKREVIAAYVRAPTRLVRRRRF